MNHAIIDPRDGQTLLVAARTGHLGPTIFRSNDRGRTFHEATRPPAFPKHDAKERTVSHTFALTPAHASEPGVWYAGTSPEGLFRSEDAGETWEPVAGFTSASTRAHHRRPGWTGRRRTRPMATSCTAS